MLETLSVVFASSNAHKLEELRSILPKHFKIKGLRDIGFIDEIPETGSTIAENSLIKAKFLDHLLNGKLSNELVFSDDSGLEVEALNGAPGVYSARYAGEPKDDAANNKKLLEALKNVSSRKARFVTVITLIVQGTQHVFEGEVSGTIAHEPRGNTGFGYDPLFIPTGYRSTFAELGPELKNTISHRAIAVEKLRRHLEDM